jgi:hypothetical protein
MPYPLPFLEVDPDSEAVLVDDKTTRPSRGWRCGRRSRSTPKMSPHNATWELSGSALTRNAPNHDHGGEIGRKGGRRTVLFLWGRLRLGQVVVPSVSTTAD